MKGSDFPADKHWAALLDTTGKLQLCKGLRTPSQHIHPHAWANPNSCPSRLPWSTQASSMPINQHSLLKSKWHRSHTPHANDSVQVPFGPTLFLRCDTRETTLELETSLLAIPLGHLLDQYQWSWTKEKATVHFVMMNTNGLWHNCFLWGGLSCKVGIYPSTLSWHGHQKRQKMQCKKHLQAKFKVTSMFLFCFAFFLLNIFCF